MKKFRVWLSPYQSGVWYCRVSQWCDEAQKYRPAFKKATGTKRKREAERFRIELETSLNEPKIVRESIDTYAQQYLAGLKSKGYRGQFRSAYEHLPEVRETIEIDHIDQIFVDEICDWFESQFHSPSTTASYLRSIRAFFNWLHARDIIPAVRFRIPSVDDIDAARGEPLLISQYHAILDAIPLVFETVRGQSFREFIRGLWLSGFRLDELFRLSWDDETEIHVKSFDTPNPIIAFPQSKSKGQKYELWGIPADFLELLRQLPRERTGRVFRPLGADLQPYQISSTVGKQIVRVTEKAGVTVEGNDGLRFASANDFRRSFAQRWYEITGDVTKAQRLARHKTDFITKRFYAREKAERLQDRINSDLKRWENR